MASRREKELEDSVRDLSQQVDDLRAELARRPAGRASRANYEYKSATTWLGLPLVHVCTGPDPETGRPRVARGVFALGDVAVGIVALGGAAFGGIAFGGLTIGAISFGGLAIGILAAVGGMALGAIAFGGIALGGIAVGGLAVGYVAIGGGASGVYATGGEYSSVRDFADVFTDPYLPDWVKRIIHSLWELR